MENRLPAGLLFFCTLLILNVHAVSAQDFSSASYTVLSPVIEAGGFATSASFGLQGIVAQLGIGTSTAAGSCRR